MSGSCGGGGRRANVAFLISARVLPERYQANTRSIIEATGATTSPPKRAF